VERSIIQTSSYPAILTRIAVVLAVITACWSRPSLRYLVEPRSRAATLVRLLTVRRCLHNIRAPIDCSGLAPGASLPSHLKELPLVNGRSERWLPKRPGRPH
jgi:hypothetical protein